MRMNVPYLLSEVALILDHAMVQPLNTEEYKKAQRHLMSLAAEHVRLEGVIESLIVEPVVPMRCIYRFKDGIRCDNTATPQTYYCRDHV
jgi:hypothetical protein